MRPLFFGLITFVCSLSFGQTPLSGTVNVYGVLEGQSNCPPTITVSNAAAFSPGMAVVILQMGNASINTDNSESFGDITDLGGTGLFEYNRIVTINGNELVLERSLLRNYTPLATQVIGAQIYENAVVVDPVRPTPWNGETGGVIFIETANTLLLQAAVDAIGTGYRGGTSIAYEGINCNLLTFNSRFGYGTGNWRGAPKGEGIAPLVNGQETGRGAQANGGGGGNNHNSGGGGGALHARGGQGGENNEPSFGGCDGFFPGQGGKSIPYSADRLFLGGGGGSGHSNNTLQTAGGNGGGIIILIGQSIVFDGGQVTANGASAQNLSGDGGGGGGAGGSIVMLSPSISNADFMLLSATGGGGGTIDNRNDDRCFGPGGGGSGGLLLSNLSVPVNLTGGTPGLSTNSTSCNTGTNDAEAGEDGIQQMLMRLPQGEPSGPPVALQSISNDTIACPGDVISLVAEIEGSANYQWQQLGSNGWEDLPEGALYGGTQTTNLLIAGGNTDRVASYRLQITPIGSCSQPITSDEIGVSHFDLPSAMPDFIRNDFTVDFTSNATATESYFWYFGPTATSMEVNPSFTFPGEGQYVVELTITNDCGSTSYQLLIDISRPLEAGIDALLLSGCAPLTVIFEDTSIGNVVTRNWQFPGGEPATSNDASPIVTFNEVGMYEVTLQVSNDNSSSEEQVMVVVVAPPVPNFNWQATENVLEITNLSTNASQYSWNFGDGNTSTEASPVHTYATSGTYDVSLSASNGLCAVAISQTISIVITNTETLQPIEWRVYPNPTKTHIQLSAPATFVRLYNQFGQQLHTWSAVVPNTPLSVSSYPSGHYWLLIQQHDRQAVWPLVIEQ